MLSSSLLRVSQEASVNVTCVSSLAPSAGGNSMPVTHKQTRAQPLLASPSLPNYIDMLTLLVMIVWSE